MVRAILNEIDGELVPKGLGGVIGVRYYREMEDDEVRCRGGGAEKKM
uniref:Uncharacterized protein n=1 Tax=Oryza meridionalis TaxID=40149 RepID=A0A0E0D319_9ORYZ